MVLAVPFAALMSVARYVRPDYEREETEDHDGRL